MSNSHLASQAAYCIRQSLIDHDESNGLYVIDQALLNCPDEDTANLLARISKAFVDHWYMSYVMYRRVVDDRMWCVKIAASLMMAYLNHRNRDIEYVLQRARDFASKEDIDAFCVLDGVSA